MVMSVGWNPYFKNEKITAVRLVSLLHPPRISEVIPRLTRGRV